MSQIEAPELERMKIAIKEGDEDGVRDLLRENPGLVSQSDANGTTPLHSAVLLGNRRIANLLIESGADVNARDRRWGATPAGWAIEYLRDQGGLLAIEIEDLLFAIERRDAVWVDRFLRRFPALVDSRDETGRKLSQHARDSENEEIIRLFEEAPDGR